MSDQPVKVGELLEKIEYLDHRLAVRVYELEALRRPLHEAGVPNKVSQTELVQHIERLVLIAKLHGYNFSELDAMVRPWAPNTSPEGVHGATMCSHCRAIIPLDATEPHVCSFELASTPKEP